MLVEYVDGGDLAIFDGQSFRRDKNTGYFLSSKPIRNGKRVRLHVYVWEKMNGPLPDGWHVHHIDFDKNNNEPENLRAMPEEEHLSLHAQLADKEELRKRVDRIRPLAAKWHGSPEGRAWHKEHGKDVWKDREPKEYTCTWCGKKFTTLNRYGPDDNHFCSNACKSAFRRASHVDDVDRRCTVCGKTFRVNKYDKMDRCPDCRRGKGKAKRPR